MITKEDAEKLCNCAGVILLKKHPQHQIILVESKRKKYQFSFPKGKREKGEDTLTAAKRELKEETGIKEGDYMIYSDKFYIEYKRDTDQPHMIYYFAILTNEDVEVNPENPEELVACKWYSPNEVYKMKEAFYLQRKQILSQCMRDYSYSFED